MNLEQFAQQLSDKRRQLPLELAVFISSRIARGLAYAHAKAGTDGKPLGIVHRDVSFKNIMIAFEGDVKLTDFGIAKARGFLTDQEGEVVAGKADYMSPEQADFQITDKRSDLFSVGVVLANLLLGHNILQCSTAEESRQRILKFAIPDFRTLTTALMSFYWILQRCLARDLRKRFASADELMYELEYYIYHGGYGRRNQTLGKFIRELFGQSGPADRGQPRAGEHGGARAHRPPSGQTLRLMKRAATGSVVKLGLLQSACSADPPANLKRTLALAERAARRVPVSSAPRSCSAPAFLPERSACKFQTGGADSRSEHCGLATTCAQTQGCHHRLAV